MVGHEHGIDSTNGQGLLGHHQVFGLRSFRSVMRGRYQRRLVLSMRAGASTLLVGNENPIGVMRRPIDRP